MVRIFHVCLLLVCCTVIYKRLDKIMMLEDEGGSAGQNILQESKGGYRGGIL